MWKTKQPRQCNDIHAQQNRITRDIYNLGNNRGTLGRVSLVFHNNNGIMEFADTCFNTNGKSTGEALITTLTPRDRKLNDPVPKMIHDLAFLLTPIIRRYKFSTTY
ncbi:uncharacterized protein ACN427_010420 isoform 2-T17 [Glossina fuscipes fuscipes]